MKRGQLLTQLADGSLIPNLAPVYGSDAPAAAARLLELTEEFAGTFPCGGDTRTLLFSAPGRTELGGNHTDHQHGHGLAASVDLDTIACVCPNDTSVIRIKSRPPPHGGDRPERSGRPSGGGGPLRVPAAGRGRPGSGSWGTPWEASTPTPPPGCCGAEASAPPPPLRCW